MGTGISASFPIPSTGYEILVDKHFVQLNCALFKTSVVAFVRTWWLKKICLLILLGNGHGVHSIFLVLSVFVVVVVVVVGGSAWVRLGVYAPSLTMDSQLQQLRLNIKHPSTPEWNYIASGTFVVRIQQAIMKFISCMYILIFVNVYVTRQT